MNNSKLNPEKFIELSREYVDDVMGDRKIKIKKEHYYIYAISNFIATKEYFLKTKIEKQENGKSKHKHVFDIEKNKAILYMIIEFYDMVKGKNKYFKETSLEKMKKDVIIMPENYFLKIKDTEGGLDEKLTYEALYLFKNVRNALSHSDNYTIKEVNDENIISINNKELNINIPVELFDFISFYINSYYEGTSMDEIMQNYIIYKNSKENKKYYNFESKNAMNKITKLLAKTQARIKKNTLTLTRNRSGSNSINYLEETINEFIDNYGEYAYQALDKINNANISEREKLELLVESNIIFRTNLRLTKIKIDECSSNLNSMLKLDRRLSSLYSHSIILFTNRKEPSRTNVKDINNIFKKIKRKLLSIDINNIEKLDNERKKEILNNYKQVMIKILEELPNLIRIEEHRYRNSVLHNNLKFENKKLYFWNQKDNTNPNDDHTYDIRIKPEIYNLELKNIEDFNMNIGELPIMLLFRILEEHNLDKENEMMIKLWNINQFDNGILRQDITINEFINNIDNVIKKISMETR